MWRCCSCFGRQKQLPHYEVKGNGNTGGLKERPLKAAHGVDGEFLTMQSTVGGISYALPSVGGCFPPIGLSVL